MSLLSRDSILEADDRKTESVDVPEWGGEVLVRALSGTERDSYEQSLVQLRKGGDAVPKLDNLRAKLVARTVVDEEGNLLFRREDVNALGQKSAVALERVYNKAIELSGMGDSADEDAEGN